MTKKAIMEMLKGKRVVVHYEGFKTVDDNERLRQELLELMASENVAAERLKENDYGFTVDGYSNVWRKSKIEQDVVKVFSFNSKDTILFPEDDSHDYSRAVYGSIPKVSDMEIHKWGYKKWVDKENGQSITYILESMFDKLQEVA